MIELKAFGTLGLNTDITGSASGGGFAIPSFLLNRRFQGLLQVMLVVGSFALLSAVFISQKWWLLCLLPVIVLPLIVLIAWLGYRYSMSWAQPALLLASDEYLHRGGTIEMLLKQQVLRDVEYKRIKIQIVMREWVRYPCGTNSCIDTFDHIIREHEELGPINVRQNASLERRVRFDLPTYLMHAFHTSDNRISWFVRVMIDIQGLPETTQYYRIDLEPENILL